MLGVFQLFQDLQLSQFSRYSKFDHSSLLTCLMLTVGLVQLENTVWGTFLCTLTPSLCQLNIYDPLTLSPLASPSLAKAQQLTMSSLTSVLKTCTAEEPSGVGEFSLHPNITIYI